METRKKILSQNELIPQYIELLNSGAQLPLTISGTSMIPFLTPERDSVTLKAIDRKIVRGDIVFYKRANGACVLHRVYKIDGDKLWLVGDAQDEVEGPISLSCAFAYVVEARRKGKTIKEDSTCWKFFASTWLKLVGKRKSILSALSFAARIRISSHD